MIKILVTIGYVPNKNNTYNFLPPHSHPSVIPVA